MIKLKSIWKFVVATALLLAIYGYARANAVVIILGDDFFVIPLGDSSSGPESLSYEYDALGRLVEVETGAGTRQTYNLDAAGNRTVIQIF